MKRSLIIIILCLAGHMYSQAQCAFAFCKNTGAWGAAYNDGTNHLTDQQYKELAVKTCRDNGGTGCSVMGIDNAPGWWAMISGNNGYGVMKIGIVEGKDSKDQAESGAIRAYESSGGVNTSNFKVYSWRVYPRD